MSEKQRNQIRKRGASYQVSIDLGRDPMTGKRPRLTQTFPTRAEARAWRDDTLAKLNRGVLTDDGRITLGRYLSSWLDTSLVSRAATTRSTLRSIVERHILSSPIAAVRLGRLTTNHVAELYGSLPEHGTTRLRVHRALHAALEEAVDRDLIGYNPAAKRAVRQSYRRVRKVKAWTEDEAAVFLTAAPGEVGRGGSRFDGMLEACHVGLYTGLRPSELYGLEWSDLDADRGTLTVERKLTVVRGRRLLEDYPKTDSSRRTVELDPTTVGVLQAWRRQQLEDRIAAGPQWQASHQYAGEERPNRFVFTYRSGEALHGETFGGWFTRAARAAGVPDIGPHGMRHSHATILLANGGDLFYVSRRLGHSSTAVTDAYYGHVIAAAAKRTAASFAEILGRVDAKWTPNGAPEAVPAE